VPDLKEMRGRIQIKLGEVFSLQKLIIALDSNGKPVRRIPLSLDYEELEPDIIDGFVKSPSAALRFTPALLDQKPRIEGIGRGSDFQKEDSSWGLSNRVNRCGVPCKYASLLRFCAPCIWNFLLCHPKFDFLRDHHH